MNVSVFIVVVVVVVAAAAAASTVAVAVAVVTAVNAAIAIIAVGHALICSSCRRLRCCCSCSSCSSCARVEDSDAGSGGVDDTGDMGAGVDSWTVTPGCGFTFDDFLQQIARTVFITAKRISLKAQHMINGFKEDLMNTKVLANSKTDCLSRVRPLAPMIINVQR